MRADGFDDATAEPDASPGPPGLGAPYWRLWTSAGLSNLADGVFKVALPLVAIQYTRSPALIAGLAFAFTLPWLLFALHAGALADRLDRRHAMLGANVLRAAIMAVLVAAVVADVGSIWVLYAVAVAVGVTETLYDTSAQSIIPQLVRRDQLSRANGRLYAAELTANEFVGPPLGGFLVAAGAVVAFATPVGLWAVAVGALLLVPGRFRIERPQRTRLRADIAEGLRFLMRNRLLRTLAIMVGGSNLATNAVFAVFVLYAVGSSSAMGLSEPAFGLLLAAIAAGSLVGSLTAERVERRLGRARALALGVIATAATLGAPAATANPFVIGAAFFVGGAGIVIWNVIVVSLRQRVSPDRLLGRVNSSFRLFAWGTRPVGAIIGGVMAELLGLRAVFAVMAVVALAMLVGMRVVTDAAMDAAERAAETA